MNNNEIANVDSDNTSEFIFQLDSGKPWIMKIGRVDGSVRIQFNRHDYPDATPDEFAQAVIEIVEGTGLFDALRDKSTMGDAIYD